MAVSIGQDVSKDGVGAEMRSDKTQSGLLNSFKERTCSLPCKLRFNASKKYFIYAKAAQIKTLMHF